MAFKLRTKRPDARLKQIARVLEKYSETHPGADVEAYRQDEYCVHIRIIDPAFKGVSRARREDDLWRLLEEVPDDVVADINVLLLLTPEEARTSVGSFAFDHPLPPLLPRRKAR